MSIKIENSWQEALGEELRKAYFAELLEAVQEAYCLETVYPPVANLFSAFQLTPFSEVKVVILGQDPYHGEGQAHGLAFSVRDGVAVPPSLQNIYKEVTADMGELKNSTGDLSDWAKQGVLLLNTTLTVRSGAPGSHRKLGWETFTDNVIKTLAEDRTGLVFMLWGNYAIAKKSLIDQNKHLLLTAPHPSPLSAHRGFLGCRHFSQCDEYLKETGSSPIIW